MYMASLPSLQTGNPRAEHGHMWDRPKFGSSDPGH